MSIRNSLRTLRRAPAFALALVISLALGLASVATLFAVIYGVLFAPLPYGEADRLVSIGLRNLARDRIEQPPALFQTYKQHVQQIDDIAFYRTGNANIWRDGEVAERVDASWISASMLPVLQVVPLLGRSFSAQEELSDGPQAVLLSESMWRTRFDGAPEVIGKTLIVNSVAREIIGVMPASFSFPNPETRLWLPTRLKSDAVLRDFAYFGIARLDPGATLASVQAQLVAVLPRLAESHPVLESGSPTASWIESLQAAPVVLALNEERTRGIKNSLWLLGAASGLVLLVAWTNAANLMLMRADSRMPELAVRNALGAGFHRLTWHFFGEALVLGLGASGIALLLVASAIGLLRAFAPADIPRLAELQLGPMTLGFVLAVSALGVFLCSAVPALRISRAGRAINLRDGRGESTGRARRRIQSGMVVLQIAIAFVVAISSTLLLRTTQRLSEVDPGFDANNVNILWTQLPFARYDDAAAVSFYAQLAQRVRALPRVHAAGVSAHVPLSGGETLQQNYLVQGKAHALTTNVIDDGYFAAMRIPLRSGRGFHALAEQNSHDVVLNQRAAQTFFPDVDAVGGTVTLAPSGPSYTVVGVVGDVRAQALERAPEPMIYRPQVVPGDPALELSARRTMALVVHSDAPPAALNAAIRQIAQELDPSAPIFGVEALQDVLEASTAQLRFVLALFSIAASITLLLGMIGLYGVMAYWVALGRRENAIRVAIGAKPSSVAAVVVLRALLLCALGLLAGLALYAFATPFLRAFLFGVSAADPLTLTVSTLLLILATLAASCLPAHRAAQVDPLAALRAE